MRVFSQRNTSSLQLTPAQVCAIRWLRPGTWWEPTLAVTRGLYRLAHQYPQLCERAVRQTKRGPVPEYRLTEVGEVMRTMLERTDA